MLKAIDLKSFSNSCQVDTINVAAAQEMDWNSVSAMW